MCQSMHNCRLWPFWGFLFPPNALEEQINKVCVPVPWVTAIFMVTSLSRVTVEHGGALYAGELWGLSWTHHSLTQSQWVCSWLPWRHKASPPCGDLYSAAAPPPLALGGWGPRRELKKKEGAVVLDKETIDVSAFSPSLNWDGDKIKSSGRKPIGDLKH